MLQTRSSATRTRRERRSPTNKEEQLATFKASGRSPHKKKKQKHDIGHACDTPLHCDHVMYPGLKRSKLNPFPPPPLDGSAAFCLFYSLAHNEYFKFALVLSRPRARPPRVNPRKKEKKKTTKVPTALNKNPRRTFLIDRLDEGEVLGEVLLSVIVRLGAGWAVLLAREHGQLLDVPVENLGYACRLRLVGRQRVHGIPQAVRLFHRGKPKDWNQSNGRRGKGGQVKTGRQSNP